MSSLVEKTSRKEYHDRWDAIAREETAKVEDEEKADADASKEALGTDKGPNCEAEALDLAAREKLKEAKRAVERRQAEERAMELVVGADAGPRTTIDAAALGDRRVVVVRGCRDARVTLAADLAPKLIKVFVSDCRDCALSLECGLVTSFVEVSRCERSTLFVRAKLHTVQCDLCVDCTIAWASPALFDAAAPEGPRVFSAACTGLVVDAGGGRTSTAENLDDALPDSGVRADEQQFVTACVGGQLLTERVVAGGTSTRLVGATARDLEAEGAAAPAGDLAAAADRDKCAGNQAFGNREYAQAAVHYTMALESGGAAPAGRGAAVLYANRSACFLKLGDHAKALADADASVAADGAYCKAHFRKGLALHALKRYRDALPALAQAQKLEPKNKQIAEALKFAEMRLARG